MRQAINYEKSTNLVILIRLKRNKTIIMKININKLWDVDCSIKFFILQKSNSLDYIKFGIYE